MLEIRITTKDKETITYHYHPVTIRYDIDTLIIVINNSGDFTERYYKISECINIEIEDIEFSDDTRIIRDFNTKETLGIIQNTLDDFLGFANTMYDLQDVNITVVSSYDNIVEVERLASPNIYSNTYKVVNK